MNTAKNFLPLILTLLSTSAFAQISAPVTATDCTVRVKASGGLADFWRGKYNDKVERVLTAKGYVAVEEGPATYELSLGGGAGFTCGTGLTWKEAILHMQTLYQVEFTGPGVHVQKAGYADHFIVGAGLRAKKQAFDVIRSLPNCSATETTQP